VPTPHSLIKINIDRQRGIILDLPREVSRASVSFTPLNDNADVYLNGRLSSCVKCPRNESRESVRVLELAGPGHYEILRPMSIGPQDLSAAGETTVAADVLDHLRMFSATI